MHNVTKNALALSVLALAAAGAAKGGLAVVPPVDETEAPKAAETGKDLIDPAGNSTEEAKGPVVATGVYDDLDALDIKMRAAPRDRVDFGFKDWAIGQHGLVTEEYVTRARGALKSAMLTQGKDNGKRFITRAAKGLPQYPKAVKGDIEVIRMKDIAGYKDGVKLPVVAAEAPKVAEPA